MTFRTVIGSLAVSGILFPVVTNAAPPCNGPVTHRPLSDFLDAQGQFVNFFPPVPDYLGWVNGEFACPPPNPDLTFALIDYAGLADAYLGNVLETDVLGQVKQRECADGTAEIRVKVSTDNALGFALLADDPDSEDDICGIGFAAPTIFGNTATDAESSASAATGTANLKVTFYIQNPDDPLPDLTDFNSNAAAYSPIKLSFSATIFEKKKEGFDSNRTLRVQQKATAEEGGDIVYTKEVVEIRPKD